MVTNDDRKLGRFELGLGTGGLREHNRCVEAVTAALDAGYRHIDTARAYGNERAIGRAIAQSAVSRGDIFLATKVHSRALSADGVRASVTASRQALDVDTIDLAYVHWPAHTYDPRETLDALADLRARGAIRHVGVSNFTADLLEEACSVSAAPIFAVQVELHPMLQQPEVRRVATIHGIRVVAHTPLCRGDVANIPTISAIAETHGLTDSQVVLSWLASKDAVTAIPGTSGRHLAENRDAVEYRLPSRALERIDAIAASDEAWRYVDYEFAPWTRR
jgi:2,5-diketo-D-gluconate reductase B